MSQFMSLKDRIVQLLTGQRMDPMAKSLREEEKLKETFRHGMPLLTHHYRGELDDGQKFVFCPIGKIVSWSLGDYENEWCHWCKVYYKDKKA